MGFFLGQFFLSFFVYMAKKFVLFRVAYSLFQKLKM